MRHLCYICYYRFSGNIFSSRKCNLRCIVFKCIRLYKFPFKDTLPASLFGTSIPIAASSLELVPLFDNIWCCKIKFLYHLTVIQSYLLFNTLPWLQFISCNCRSAAYICDSNFNTRSSVQCLLQPYLQFLYFHAIVRLYLYLSSVKQADRWKNIFMFLLSTLFPSRFLQFLPIDYLIQPCLLYWFYY